MFPIWDHAERRPELGRIGGGDDFVAVREREKAAAVLERKRAEGLWKRFEKAGGVRAWKEALADPELRSWAFCERLCHESAAVAEDDPRRAGSLAELALELASMLPGEKDRRPQTLEYVWAHLGNVRRVLRDLEGAEEAFKKAQRCFIEAVGLLPSVLDRGRTEALQALLRRDQGHLRDALEKLDFGLRFLDAKAPDRPAFLLEKGRLHRRLGNPERAVQALAEAAAALPARSDPRLLLRIRLELGSALCELGRYEEARSLPALPPAAETAGGDGERARLICLAGRIAAGAGRPEEAEAALQKAYRTFQEGPAAQETQDGMTAADLALLSLEAAALCAREGRMTELREVTGRILELSASPALGREAAATLKLFCRLAGQDKLSAERAARFAEDFSKSSSRG